MNHQYGPLAQTQRDLRDHIIDPDYNRGEPAGCDTDASRFAVATPKGDDRYQQYLDLEHATREEENWDALADVEFNTDNKGRDELIFWAKGFLADAKRLRRMLDNHFGVIR